MQTSPVQRDYLLFFPMMYIPQSILQFHTQGSGSPVRKLNSRSELNPKIRISIPYKQNNGWQSKTDRPYAIEFT
jgi:hypothetical protein